MEESGFSKLTSQYENMNAGAKGIILVIGAYFVTLAVTIFIILLAILILLDPNSCSAMGRALLVVGGTIAVVFITSIVVVRVVAWKVIPGKVGRLAIMAVYVVAMLASYVVIAFGLLVLFNC
jgi:hypothetical protein